MAILNEADDPFRVTEILTNFIPSFIIKTNLQYEKIDFTLSISDFGGLPVYQLPKQSAATTG